MLFFETKIPGKKQVHEIKTSNPNLTHQEKKPTPPSTYYELHKNIWPKVTP